MTALEQQLTEIIQQGLVSGLGEPKPGELCIEAAICLALGEPHSDAPSCVAAPDRSYSMRINDCKWSSSQTRAEALLPLALAQLGTEGTDRIAWVQHLNEGTIRRMLPPLLRGIGLDTAANRCESEGTADAAESAARVAANAAANAANADVATTVATTAASYAAAAADAADYAAAADAAYNDAGYEAAYTDAGYAAAYAAYAAAKAVFVADPDKYLKLSVQIALDAYEATAK